MEIIAYYKGRPFSIFVDFVSHFALLQSYSNHLLLSFSKHQSRIECGSHLKSLDAFGPGNRIFKACALARWRPNGDKI